MLFKNVPLPNGWVCPYLTQNWVKTTQHFLECMFNSVDCIQLSVEFALLPHSTLYIFNSARMHTAH